ncbi:hypothetical protein [Geminisphaera colitermitum]|uniref:hypothetical protein n=1 Tax=Geminisphaera colitermitum TaxID=1148786 RepID=UPI00019653A2|nr:hypothetical protein [Geminisphaera colitermitum]
MTSVFSQVDEHLECFAERIGGERPQIFVNEKGIKPDTSEVTSEKTFQKHSSLMLDNEG